MDQTILNLVGGAAISAGGWLIARLIGQQDKLQKEMSDLRVLLVGQYVTGEKLQQVLGELRGDLRYIRERMDQIPRRKGENE